MLRALKHLLRNEKGQVIEYGLLIALIVAIGLLFAAGLVLRARGPAF